MAEERTDRSVCPTMKPGQEVPISGQYAQVNRGGKVQAEGLEATLVAGEPAPPTDRKTWRWRLVDASEHADTGGDEDAEIADHWARPEWMEPDPDNPGMWRERVGRASSPDNKSGA